MKMIASFHKKYEDEDEDDDDLGVVADEFDVVVVVVVGVVGFVGLLVLGLSLSGWYCLYWKP